MAKILNFFCVLSLVTTIFGSPANLNQTNTTQNNLLLFQDAHFIGVVNEINNNAGNINWWVTTQEVIAGPVLVGENEEVRLMTYNGPCSGSYDMTIQVGDKVEVLGWFTGQQEIDLCGQGSGYLFIKKVVTCPALNKLYPLDPPDNAILDDNTPFLDYEIDDKATEYHVQVDNNADFSSPVIDVKVPATYVTGPLADGHYYWRVRGHNTANGCDTYSVWSNVWSFTISTSPVNHAPVAENDFYSINEDTPLSDPAPGVMRNDTDADGNTLTAILVTGPSHGTLTLNANGSFTYTPYTNWYGTDSFTYKVNDGNLNSNTATVYITVNSVCDAPDVPVRTSPGNNATTNDNTPTFIWNAAAQATNYQLQVDNNSDFSSPVINITSTSTSYTPTSTLADGTYYWRVRSRNTAGGCSVYSSWSSAWTLTILPAWTLMYYLDGDNSDLERSEKHIFNQLEKGAGKEGVTIVALWASKERGTSNYYKVKHDENPDEPAAYAAGEMVEKGKTNLGDPKTLTDFLNWSMTNYPARQYALILSDHGGGLSGAMKDELFSGTKLNGDKADYDILTLKEIRNVLQTVETNQNKKINVLYFDACLMGMVEVGYEFRNLADYLVASEDLSYFVNDDQVSNALNKIDSSTSPINAASAFSTSYDNSMQKVNEKGFRPVGYTIAIADLSKAAELKTAIDNWAGDLDMGISVNALKLWDIRARRATKFSSRAGYDYYDIYDLAQHVRDTFTDQKIKDDSQQVIDAIDNNYIISIKTLYSDVMGVSVFFPGSSSSFYTSDNFEFATGTAWNKPKQPTALSSSAVGWGNLIADVVQVMNPSSQDNPNPPEPLPLQGVFSIVLPIMTR